jgi:hypothetical protein
VNPRLQSAAALLALAGAAAPDLLSWSKLKETIRDTVDADPMDAALGFIGTASLLFYVAEKGQNPKVETLGDAFVFISTCMSVGYSDIFARTEAGKAVATIVMTYGPALSANLLRKGPEDTRIVDRLDRLLAALTPPAATIPGPDAATSGSA